MNWLPVVLVIAVCVAIVGCKQSPQPDRSQIYNEGFSAGYIEGKREAESK